MNENLIDQNVDYDVVEVMVPAAEGVLPDWGALGCGSQHHS